LVSKTIKSFIYMGCGVNKLIFGITGTEEPKYFCPITYIKSKAQKKRSF